MRAVLIPLALLSIVLAVSYTSTTGTAYQKSLHQPVMAPGQAGHGLVGSFSRSGAVGHEVGVCAPGPYASNVGRFLGIRLDPLTPPRLGAELASFLAMNHRGRWWVYFVDKGTPEFEDRRRHLQRVERSLTESARERRINRTGSLALNARDLPVYDDYLEALRAEGARVRGTSRWLNAATVYAGPDQLSRISELPFVSGVRPVATFRRERVEILEPSVAQVPSVSRPAPAADPSYYNRTYDQLEQINVPAVHDIGYRGEGVIVCMLDTGYNLAHEAFLELDVVAEWDFVQDDSVTSNQPGDYESQHNHGTITMSTIGGLKAYEFVGGAPNAQFALAKTEIQDQEIQIEEDYYVMGLEWADSVGATVVSSSLGYLDWYTYEDMDGETAVTTNAVDVAASKGITVVTAMGNEQYTPWHYLIAPADADSVIAVGAVNSSGELTGFSSVGPTADGRLKPDVVARGLSTSAVSPWDSTGYTLASGTSLSTPLVAGTAALLAQAHPDWGPVEIRQALRYSADQAFSPDTLRGYGLPDALAALQMDTVDSPGYRPTLAAYSSPNPFRSRTALHFTLEHEPGGDVPVQVLVYDARGRLVRDLYSGSLPAGPHSVEWDGLDSYGRPSPSGIYMLVVKHPGGEGGSKALLIR